VSVPAISTIHPNKFPIAKEAYYKPEYVALEKAKLWSRVWQMACRVEELKAVGDYVTYEIADESVIVVRTAPGELGAFHNACQHRGRRLLKGCGTIDRIRCSFHGWVYELNGACSHVTQRADWQGSLDDQDLSLKKVKVDTWGGFVFVNLDPACEPLAKFLEAVPQLLAPFELEQMRYRWRKWLVMPSNWKIAMEAFNEGYHVHITHHQLRRFGMEHFLSRTFGKHGMFGTASGTGSLGVNAAKEEYFDIRGSMGEYYKYMKGALDSTMTDTLMHASAKLETAVPEGTPPSQVLARLTQLAMEEDAARGFKWPAINVEQYNQAGIDWHIFPNMVLLPMATNCLGYRSRPNGDDPDSCIFEVFHIERFPAGEEPEVKNLRNDDIYDAEFWGEILLQDFQQMESTHQGVKSSGFLGSRPNPLQETALTNFHRVYHEYLNAP
jgi:phenylpropionate dioxygenase-like ring-hydroxylating dioxygenase large terminal subunit